MRVWMGSKTVFSARYVCSHDVNEGGDDEVKSRTRELDADLLHLTQAFKAAKHRHASLICSLYKTQHSMCT